MKSCLNVLLIFNLILIIYSFTIIDQRIFTKNDKYEYIIKDNNILTKFSFSFFFRFKTFFTFPAMLTETSIISISKSDPSIKTSFAFKTDSTNISILLRSSQNIIFEEFLPRLTNTLSDWFFIGISCNETDIFWYILDSTKRVIYSKKELKKPSLSINFNDKVTINPDGYFFFHSPTRAIRIFIAYVIGHYESLASTMIVPPSDTADPLIVIPPAVVLMLIV